MSDCSQQSSNLKGDGYKCSQHPLTLGRVTVKSLQKPLMNRQIVIRAMFNVYCTTEKLFLSDEK
ncbi:MAG: hypothetical protein ACPGEF_04865 [Endozoicomonas sp.]